VRLSSFISDFSLQDYPDDFIQRPAASALSALVGLGLFLTMGVGMFMAGTAYLSLIADLTIEAERGKETVTFACVGPRVRSGLSVTPGV